jgi:hypothetical protein
LKEQRCPDRVAIEDLNADGIADLVVTNGCAGTVTVREGMGAGVLGKRVDFVAGDLPIYIVSRDLNGDGRPDLAISGASVTVLLSTCPTE